MSKSLRKWRFKIIVVLFFVFLLSYFCYYFNVSNFRSQHSSSLFTAECCDVNISSEDDILTIQRQNYYERTHDIESPNEEKLIQRNNYFDRTHILTEVEINQLAYIIAAEASGVDSDDNKKEAKEAGINCDTWQQYVGYVVMNRVYQSSYPDTIENVFFDGDAYAEESREKYNDEFVTERARKNAIIVLSNFYHNSEPVPRNMVYQSEFEQGTTYLHVGNTFFGINPNLPET